MFSETDKKIFGPFFDGEGEAYADPLAVQEELDHLLNGSVADVTTRANAGFDDDGKPGPDVEAQAPVRYEANRQIREATVVALGLHPFDRKTGKGLRRAEIIGLFNAFQDWLEKKSAPAAGTPTSPTATAGPPPGPSATPTTSGSPSTSAG